MAYKESTLDLMDQVNKTGFNIFAMIHLFRKKSKINCEIPEPVIKSVCLEYFKRQEKVNKTFPYFLMVLKEQTCRYLAQKNIAEHQRIKNEPLAIKDIFELIASRREGAQN